MSALRLTLLAAVAFLATTATAAAAVQPLTLTTLGRTAAQGETGAEIAAYDPGSKRAFTTNALTNKLDVWDLSDPTAPAALPSIDLSPYGATPNSVATAKRCGGIVAVAIEASPKTDPGKVVIFRPNGAHVKTLTVGSQPDMLTFNTSGNRLVVANEGEPASNGSVDPKGTVSIIRGIPKRNCSDLTVDNVTFDGSFPVYGDVRIYGPGATFSTNVEPEYIAIDGGGAGNGTKAYVTLQEANALATIDLATGSVDSVRGLGYKDYSLAANKLDAGDRDGPGNTAKLNITNHANLFGMYQPDAIGWYSVGGRNLLITANEGDARDWSYFSEEVRVGAGSVSLDPTVFPNAAAVKSNAQLGRLNITRSQGDTDNDGDYDKLYTLGGRSVSVIDPTETSGVAWDSGSALEDYIAATAPTLFNADHALVPAFDDRSDNKGPEPEGVAVGRVGGRPYAFVGLERQGSLVAFDLRDSIGRASIAGSINTRPLDRGPEGVSFISPGDSPTGDALVLMTSEITGTLVIYKAQVS